MQTITLDINRFLGANLDPYNQQVGEANEIINFRINNSYAVEKRKGYIEKFSNYGVIRGLWYGKLNNSYHMVYASNGHVWEGNTDLGTLVDNTTTFFVFNDKLYILNGFEFYYWTGTGSIARVEGYVPKIAISTPPAGGGTIKERINVLTGKKRQSFSPDGIAKDFSLTEKNIDSIDYIKVNGALISTGFTTDLVNGKVTFATVPTEGVDTIEIAWTKGIGQRDIVTKNLNFNIFGGTNDTRIFLYGNKNVRIYSELADGVPSAEYFPTTNFTNIGSGQFNITHIEKQYDRQIIFTERGSYYSVYENIDSLGVSYPVYPLNDKVGNVAFGQGQLILNNPYTIYNGVYEWQSTSIRDERNAVLKSAKVQDEIKTWDLTKVVTYDFEDLAELWICYNNQIWIYNYRLNVWYKYILADVPTCFCTVDNKLYFGTSTGRIMEFQNENINEDGSINYKARSDNGTIINCKLVLGFLDFGVSDLKKFLMFGHLTIKAEARAGINFIWESDQDIEDVALLFEYNFMNFNDINFNNFTFNASKNPQPFRVSIKAKNFSNIKFVLENNSLNQTVTITRFKLPAIIGGSVK